MKCFGVVGRSSQEVGGTERFLKFFSHYPRLKGRNRPGLRRFTGRLPLGSEDFL